jgi:hypothetical protein
LDHDLPPVGRFIEYHDDRLWLLGSRQQGAPDLLAYSLKGFPDIYPPGYNIPQSEWTNAGRGMGLRSIGGVLYVIFENSTFYLAGSRPEDYRLDPITPHFGCVAHESLRGYKDSLVFLSSDGLLRLAGRSQQILYDMPFDLKEEHWQDLASAAAVVVGDQYVLSFPSAEATTLEELQLARTMSFNLVRPGVGLPNVTLDIGSDDGPRKFPLACRYTVDGDEDVLAVGMSYKGADGEGAANMYLDFHWMDLGTPDFVKSLDKIEIDILAHTLYQVKFTVTGDESGTFTKTPVTTRDFPIYDTDEWDDVVSDLYPEMQRFIVELYPDDVLGRAFKLVVEEDVSGPPHTYSRKIIIDKIKFYPFVEKRR